jgi:ecdysone 20-monooxygenase
VIGAQWLYYPVVGRFKYNKYHEANDEKMKQHGRVVREEVIWNFPLIHLFDKKVSSVRPRIAPYIYTLSSQDINAVLGHRSRFPLRPPNEADVFYRNSRPEYYNDIGMVNENGKNWKHLRDHLTPPLSSPEALKHYATHMDSISHDLVTMLKSAMNKETGIIQNFKEMIYKTGLEAVCKVALERRMGFLETETSDKDDTQGILDAIHLYQKASTDSMYGLPFWKYLPASFSSCARNLMSSKDYLFKTFAKIVDETMKMDETEGANPDSILSALLKKVDTKEVDTKDVKASVVDYITAGMDTIGNSMIFLVQNLAENQAVQERLHEELDRVFPNKCDITPELLRDVPYMKACVTESFRMFPTASQIARITETEMTLSTGHTLPKQSVVLCHHRIAALQEENFTHATKFMPERWLEGQQFEQHSANLVLPFGSGKRACPGKRLAEQELNIITAKLFQHFHVELAEKPALEFNFLLTPAGSVPLKLTVRE